MKSDKMMDIFVLETCDDGLLSFPNKRLIETDLFIDEQLISFTCFCL